MVCFIGQTSAQFYNSGLKEIWYHCRHTRPTKWHGQKLPFPFHHIHHPNKNYAGHEHPNQLAFDYAQALLAKECRNTYGRYLNGPPREEITAVVERCQKGHAHSARCHGIQYWVRSGADKKVQPQHPKVFLAGRQRTVENHNHHKRQQGSRHERVRKPPVAPKAFVGHAQLEAYGINIGKNGA